MAAAAVFSAASASAATDTVKPVVQSLTVTPSPVDVTTGTKQITVQARFTDDSSGVVKGIVDATFARAASSPAGSDPNGPTGLGPIDFTRVSGTALDGVWRAVLTIPAGLKGTWSMDLRVDDAAFNQVWDDVTTLAARGITGTFPSTTTAVPSLATTKVTGRTDTQVLPYRFVVMSRYVEWTTSGGGAAPSSAVVDSASAACGKLTWSVARLYFADPIPALPCTVKYRLVNGSGYAAQASITFW